MSFQISPDLDKNRVFLINRSELKGRFDTVFYHPKYVANEAAIKTSKWGHERVGRIADRIADGPFGSDLKVEEYKTKGYPLLRVSNIRTGEVEGDLVYISDQKQRQLKRSKVYPNDVLLTKAGAILGYSAVFPRSLKEGNITSHLVTITCKEGINPHFLSHFFRSEIGQLQIYRWGNKSTRPELNTEEVKNILVTTPPNHVQARIVEYLNAAYAAKKQTELKAQQLLATIDDVLLDELGIPRKPEPPNTLESRIFRRNFSTISGKRIDPAANWKHLSFDGGKYPLRRLHDVVSINPMTRFPKLAPGTPVSFVPMDAVSDVFGEIADRQTRPIEETGSYTPFQDGDVIWAKITPCMENGKAAVAEGLVESVGYGSTEFHVFRRRSLELFPHFLHHLLRLKTVREHARRNFTGSSGHQRVDENFFYRMEIPFPPMKIQERVAEKAEATKSQARKLFADARADLEKAKRDIEALILGKETAE